MTCPDVDILEQFLSGASAEEGAIEVHVAACPTCRTLLDDLSDNPDLRRWVPHALSLGSEITPQTIVLRILADLESSADPVSRDEVRPGNNLACQAGSLVGSYRIEQEIGRGGMGMVLRAYDETLCRTVALKVLAAETADTRARARLVHEAQAVARLRHPNVVTLYSVVSPPDAAPFLVMEYVEGVTLAARINSQGRRPRRSRPRRPRVWKPPTRPA
jgi:serine/threonine protein kinase